MKLSERKRNIKMPNCKKSVVNNRSQVLVSSGRGKYNLPTYDVVPTGNYFSEIVSARRTQTKSGYPAIEILCDIKDAITCYKVANGKLPANTQIRVQHIKQIYMEDTQYYDEFIDAMAEAIGNRSFNLKDVVGVTEYVGLGYDRGVYGRYVKRSPCVWEDFIEEDDGEEVSSCISLEYDNEFTNDVDSYDEYDW